MRLALSLEEQARLAGRSQVARVVIVPVHALYQIGILEVQVGRICRNDGTFAQLLFQLPHVELGRKALYLHPGRVLQVIRLCRRVNLIAVLVAQGCHLIDLRLHAHPPSRQ